MLKECEGEEGCFIEYESDSHSYTLTGRQFLSLFLSPSSRHSDTVTSTYRRAFEENIEWHWVQRIVHAKSEGERKRERINECEKKSR